jgi:hypothetical protein
MISNNVEQCLRAMHYVVHAPRKQSLAVLVRQCSHLHLEHTSVAFFEHMQHFP